MKYSEWKKSYDEKYPERVFLEMTCEELLSMEFDDQPERSKREDAREGDAVL